MEDVAMDLGDDASQESELSSSSEDESQSIPQGVTGPQASVDDETGRGDVEGRSKRAAAGRASLVWQNLGGRKSLTDDSGDVVKEKPKKKVEDGVKRPRGRPRKDGRPPIQRKLGETDTEVSTSPTSEIAPKPKRRIREKPLPVRRQGHSAEHEAGPSTPRSTSIRSATPTTGPTRKRTKILEEHEQEAKQELKPSSSGRLRKAPALDPVVLMRPSPPVSTVSSPSSSKRPSAGNCDNSINAKDRTAASPVVPSSVASTTTSRHADIVSKPKRNGVATTPKGSKAVEKTTPKRRIVPQSTRPSAKRIVDSEAVNAIGPSSPSVRVNGGTALTMSSLIKPTSSDAYFVAHASRSRGKRASQMTSDHILSESFHPIPTRTITALNKQIKSLVNANEDDGESLDSTAAMRTHAHFRPLYDRWTTLMLHTNRPLLFHGLGSKKAHLEDYVSHLSSKGTGASLIVRGEGGARIDDVVREIERGLGQPSTSIEEEDRQRPLFASALEARALRIASRLSQRDGRLPPRLFVLLHNFSTPALQQPRAMRIFSMLQSSPKIHFLASVAHVQAGHLGGLGPSSLSFNDTLDQRSFGVFDDDGPSTMNWLWIDMTTFVPSLDEILTQRTASTANGLHGQSSASSASRIAGLPKVLDLQSSGLDLGPSSSVMPSELANGAAANGVDSSHDLSDRAALHILRSVTYKARALFLLLADRLLSSSSSSSTSGTATSATMSYAQLAELARRNFLAGTPDMMRVLLVEFTSHGLVRVVEGGHSQSQGAEDEGIVLGQGLANVSDSSTVSIALDPRALRRVVDEIKPKL
ncbi:hypothetical protein FA10DRAFT_302790 [Acaromyces ingoldii]|uniref:Origin recognition complex subunit 2 RecA-like domain-containing protein n=1 Tax=Acaromyces ingoldii TaxID=215250 RepID=A0A316YJR8_9BASI|nr:hypothetical protein FA10DRAFT_302790 [Acaromyces ingoldii]PWN89459.1 hypothetical protein FA10DRAFT_302790 [Acaromyces ingoldii]